MRAGRQERRRRERREGARGPREHMVKMSELCMDQRLGEGKGSGTPGLERFREGTC